MTFDEFVWYKQREAAAEATAETMVSNTQENIVELLEEYGEVPEDIREQIEKQEDVLVLKKWHKLAAKVQDFEDFRKAAMMDLSR